MQWPKDYGQKYIKLSKAVHRKLKTEHHELPHETRDEPDCNCLRTTQRISPDMEIVLDTIIRA